MADSAQPAASAPPGRAGRLIRHRALLSAAGASRAHCDVQGLGGLRQGFALLCGRVVGALCKVPPASCAFHAVGQCRPVAHFAEECVGQAARSSHLQWEVCSAAQQQGAKGPVARHKVRVTRSFKTVTWWREAMVHV